LIYNCVIDSLVYLDNYNIPSYTVEKSVYEIVFETFSRLKIMLNSKVYRDFVKGKHGEF